MIRQDYILRLIEEFMAALSLFLEKEERERSDEDIRLLYEKYLFPGAKFLIMLHLNGRPTNA